MSPRIYCDSGKHFDESEASAMIDELRRAITLLTILPVGAPASRGAGKAFAWFPLVGLLIGGGLCAVSMLSPFNRELTAALVLFCWVALTGGLHLDGFADSCDALLGHGEPEKRLAIMRDPRLGTWAALGLVLLLLTKWLAIGAIHPAWLLLPPLFGRWAMVIAAYRFPPAREAGMGAAAWRQVLFVATAEATDSEMAARIAAHRAQRPAAWHTLEAPRQVPQRIAACATPHDTLLLDCLTLLTSNLLLDLPDETMQEQADAAILREIDALLEVYERSEATWLVVSNEVGLGVVPAGWLGVKFRDMLGRANQRIAARADEVLLMVAGLPLKLK